MALTSEPPGAEVSVDGRPAGVTPVVLETRPGLFESRRVRLTHPDAVPLEVDVRQSDPYWPAVLPALVCAGPTCGLSLFALAWGTRFGTRYAFALPTKQARKTPESNEKPRGAPRPY